MRVLLTGALGFIGSHTADALLARGDHVTGVDNRTGNVVDSIPGMWCYEKDVRDIDRSEALVDLVIHTASPVGAVALLERESIVAEIIETTQAVIRFCEINHTPLINISSSEVYGFSGTYSETDACVIPHRLSHRIQYAAGKLAAEHLVRTSGLPAVTIRPFNVAGPRQTSAKGFVIPTFVEQALNGEPMTVFNGGSQQRCFTGVWDVVDFILNVDPYEHAGGVFNVGNPNNRTTIRDLAELVKWVTESPDAEVLHTTGKEIHGPEYEEAIGVRKLPDITAAVATGWRPEVPLEDLVARTVEEEVAYAHLR